MPSANPTKASGEGALSILDAMELARSALLENRRCLVSIEEEEKDFLISIQRFAWINSSWSIDCWSHTTGKLIRIPIALIKGCERLNDPAETLGTAPLSDRWDEDQDRGVSYQYKDNLLQIEKWLSREKQRLAQIEEDAAQEEAVSRRIKPIGRSGSKRQPSKVGEHWLDLGFRVDREADLPQRMVAALDGLIKEKVETNSSRISIPLSDGKPHNLPQKGECVRFPLDREVNVYEGLQVVARSRGGRVTGTIVSVASDHIFVAFEEKGHSSITDCIIQVDDTKLDERLKAQILKLAHGVAEGSNLSLSKSVLTAKEIQRIDRKTPKKFSHSLNASQKRAIENGLKKSVSYIWGPPGTGKTFTLGELTRILYEQGEKVAVCSHSNQAVDQLLLKLCEALGKDHRALHDGLVIRLGRVEHQQLAAEWEDLISVPAIANRKGRELIEEREKLEAQLEPLEKKRSKVQEQIDRFERLAELKNDLASTASNLESERSKEPSLERKKKDLTRSTSATLSKLKKKIKKAETAHQRLLLEKSAREEAKIKKPWRKVSVILSDLKKVGTELGRLLKVAKEIEEKRDLELSELLQNIERSKVNVETLRARETALKSEIESITESLVSFKEEVARATILELKEKISPLAKRLTEIFEKLAQLRESVTKDARVVGATITKTHLEPTSFKDVDVMIIDEASMAFLPAVYFAACLAKKSVVISGDFQQLQPINSIRQRALKKEIGLSVFDKSRVRHRCEKGIDFPHVTMLDTQYRMPEKICSLVAGPFYKNRLRTERLDRSSSATSSAPGRQPIVVVDTSSLHSVEQFTKDGSRYNLLHVEVIRGIVSRLKEQAKIKDRYSVGISSPFNAQTELLNAFIADEGLSELVRVRTVHRWQGDEVDCMIFDIPTGVGRYGVGKMLDRERASDDTAKVLNVAMTRARNRLIVVGNLSELDKKLPDYSVLRGILATAEDIGEVRDGRELISRVPSPSVMSSIARFARRPGRIPIDTQGPNIAPQEGPTRSVSRLPAVPVKPRKVSNDPALDQENKEKDAFFDTSQFEKRVQEDISKATRTVAIYSGFVTKKRVLTLKSLLEDQIARGVVIRCITRPPSKHSEFMRESAKVGLKLLKDLGCRIDLRDDIHQKIVILDEKIAWFGSCNPLSHTLRTDESMLRREGHHFAYQLAKLVSLNPWTYRSGDRGVSVLEENPLCPKCKGHWTVLVRRNSSNTKKGNPWRCGKNSCGHSWVA